MSEIQTCNRQVGSWPWEKWLSSTKRHAGAELLLLDSGAQFHARPIKYPGQRVPLPELGIHTAIGARLQHDGGRLVRFKFPEGRDNPSAFPMRVMFKNQLSLGCLALHEYWSDLRSDRIQTQHSQTQLHTEESLFSVKGTLGYSWCE